jgi:hypothetical protein
MTCRHFPPLFAFALLLISAPCFAWIDTGHKVVALIAWEDLTPKSRAAVTDLLKQHPRYEKDLLPGAPADESDEARARTAFAVAATWPDIVRSPANPMNHVANHPAWHYIDIPYILDGVTPPADKNDAPGPHNAVEALTQCAGELKDAKVTPADKAVDLCWIEHLTGDIHQPLHAVSLYSAKQPDGDRGGNQDMVLKDPRYRNTLTNLHLLWDSLPGDFKSEELCDFEAKGLRADPNYSREKLKDMIAAADVSVWAKESHELAISDVYLNGKLQYAIAQSGGGGGGGAAGGGANGDATPGVPPGYLLNAEHVAMKRVALAGYRLADELNAIFDAK